MRGPRVPPVSNVGTVELVMIAAVLTWTFQESELLYEAVMWMPVPDTLALALKPAAAAGCAGLLNTPRLRTSASSPIRLIQRAMRFDMLVCLEDCPIRRVIALMVMCSFR